MNGNFDYECTECESGYFLTEEGECAKCKDSPFLSGCSECSDAYTCDNCIKGNIETQVFEYKILERIERMEVDVCVER